MAVAADLNGDGRADLVDGTMSVLTGNGDGTFQPKVDLESIEYGRRFGQ